MREAEAFIHQQDPASLFWWRVVSGECRFRGRCFLCSVLVRFCPQAEAERSQSLKLEVSMHTEPRCTWGPRWAGRVWKDASTESFIVMLPNRLGRQIVLL